MRSLLLLLVVAAGCIGAPAPAADDPANAWLAREWGEATARVLVEDTIVVSKMPSRAGGVVTPGATLVLPGTQRVEVTLAWPATAGAPEAVQLLWDSGATTGRPEELTVRNGEPAVIAGDGATDAAFQPHTHWWFGVFPLPDAALVPETPVSIRVVGVRAENLPALSLAAPSDAPMVTGSVDQVRVMTVCATVCQGGAWSAAPGGAIVTNATELVRATIDWRGETDAPGIVAWTPSYDSIEMEAKGDGVWEVAPPAGALDSPYQTKSLWWFFLTGGAPARSGTGTLTVEAVAYGASR